MTTEELGKLFVFAGIIIAFVGLVLMLAGKTSIAWIGHLPGDLTFRRRNLTFYFPLATSLLVSVILSFIIWLINRK